MSNNTTNVGKPTTVDQLETAVTRAASAVSRAAASDMEVLKPLMFSLVIPTDGWEEDAEADDFALYLDITVQGVTATDRASIVIAPSGHATAADCELCPTNETMTNKIRLRTRTVPADSIQAVCWLERGRSN